MSRNSQFLCFCAVFSAFLWVLSTLKPTDIVRSRIWFELEAPLDYLPPRTLTAILPILSTTLGELNDLLQPLLNAVGQIREIIIVCPQSAAFDVRRQLRATFASQVADLDVSLWPWQYPMAVDEAVLGCVTQLTTEWALVMDENGLKGVAESVRAALLRPPNVTLPLGPEGLKNEDYIPVSSQWGLLQPAWYLYPPFVMPSSVSRSFKINYNDEKLWSQLGSHIAKSRADGIGGLRLHAAGLNGSSNTARVYQLLVTDGSPSSWHVPIPVDIHNDSFSSTTPLSDGLKTTDFIFFLPTLVDLDKVSFLVCRLLDNATRPHIRVLVYEGLHPSPHQLGWKSGAFESDNCAIDYDILTGTQPLSFSAAGSIVLANWLGRRPDHTRIVFTLKELDPLVSFMKSHGENIFPRATFISVPRTDLEYTDWMSSLTITEWQSTPRVFQTFRA